MYFYRQKLYLQKNECAQASMVSIELVKYAW
jgi:hypothetical protein